MNTTLSPSLSSVFITYVPVDLRFANVTVSVFSATPFTVKVWLSTTSSVPALHTLATTVYSAVLSRPESATSSVRVISMSSFTSASYVASASVLAFFPARVTVVLTTSGSKSFMFVKVYTLANPSLSVSTVRSPCEKPSALISVAFTV